MILNEIDFILGTTYSEDYRGNKTILMNAVAIACRNHGIGLIVIDEIQNLVAARGQDRDEILDFYTALENVKGTPIVKIGTPRSRSLFDRLHTARRAVGPVPPYWMWMEEDREWRSFCETLWEFQYTEQPCPYSDELSHLLYDLSQGILDFAVKAFLFAQLRAIHNGLPKITSELLESVVHDHFKAAEKILTAIREKDLEALENYDDVVIDFDEHWRKLINEGKQKKKKDQAQVQDEPNNFSEGAVVTKENSAKSETVGASKNPKEKAKVRKLEKKQTKTNDAFSELNPDDLRAITAESTGDSAAAYEALKSAGYIKNAGEFTNLST